MTAQKVLAKDLVPGDVLLHEGQWLHVTGSVHYPDAGVVKVGVLRLVGTETTVTLHDVDTPWIIPAGTPVPDLATP